MPQCGQDPPYYFKLHVGDRRPHHWHEARARQARAPVWQGWLRHSRRQPAGGGHGNLDRVRAGRAGVEPYQLSFWPAVGPQRPRHPRSGALVPRAPDRALIPSRRPGPPALAIVCHRRRRPGCRDNLNPSLGRHGMVKLGRPKLRRQPERDVWSLSGGLKGSG